MAGLGRARSGVARHRRAATARQGTPRHCGVRQATRRRGVIPVGMARRDVARHGWSRPGGARQARISKAVHSWARRGAACRCKAGAARRGTAGQGGARRGDACRCAAGVARRGMARHSVARQGRGRLGKAGAAGEGAVLRSRPFVCSYAPLAAGNAFLRCSGVAVASPSPCFPEAP